MKIMKCIKVIVPGLSTKSAKKHIVTHISRKKIAGASAFGGLAPPRRPLQTSPMIVSMCVVTSLSHSLCFDDYYTMCNKMFCFSCTVTDFYVMD